MTLKTHAEIFWSEEDAGFIAIDKTRPGCSAFGESESEAFDELQKARKAWDGARRALPLGRCGGAADG